ncbi:hypothetical protein SAMN02746041_02119 [Desulfacinum hydrothermale DSM 13146]|uniref:DUF1573 domain-containing protein n=1 Tax=Desulfacinum hydrothermale DSM 13146 TaxID=1121390 RepID=A0A1W1XLP0_9BACT|nr:hypothetical protein [Desulfacinum hydrothermale]SMC24863.1 hypothetical protein SAMN02746041_02119 [Desulfacinum hydrothermale DSM 13146]
MARFDRVIPPGGEGKITLKVNVAGYQGKIAKGATVYCDDPQTPRLRLSVSARVVPYVTVRPTDSVFFRGPAKTLKPVVVELESRKRQWRITGIDNGLQGKVDAAVQTVEEGRAYRLVVTNVAEQGEYSGVIICRTDHPQRPQIPIRVRGIIEGAVGVRPTSVVVGRLRAGLPVRPGRLLVVSNLNSPFAITGLDYDRSLLEVVQSPLPDRPGYRLELRPLLASVDRGTQKHTTLTIKTDAESGDHHVVNVFVVNR